MIYLEEGYKDKYINVRKFIDGIYVVPLNYYVNFFTGVIICSRDLIVHDEFQCDIIAIMRNPINIDTPHTLARLSIKLFGRGKYKDHVEFFGERWVYTGSINESHLSIGMCMNTYKELLSFAKKVIKKVMGIEL